MGEAKQPKSQKTSFWSAQQNTSFYQSYVLSHLVQQGGMSGQHLLCAQAFHYYCRGDVGIVLNVLWCSTVSCPLQMMLMLREYQLEYWLHHFGSSPLLMCSEKQQCSDPCTNVGDWGGVSGLWLQPGPVHAFIAIWAVIQLMEDVSLSFLIYTCK